MFVFKVSFFKRKPIKISNIILLSRKNNFIALDDITTYSGECKPLEEEIPDFICDEGKTQITADRRCDFYADCKDQSDESSCGTICDFEKVETDPCNWKSSTKDLAWNQTFANESANPNHDHTRNVVGDGHYMKLNYIARWVYSGVANFTSPALIRSSASCRFYFWYYFDVVHVGEILKVFYSSGHQGKRTTLFNLDADRGKSWQEAEVVVGRIRNRFQVGIEGNLKSATAVMAVDDFKFENCYLPRKLDKPEKCTDSEFQCVKTGRCISKDLLCDFVDDCGDYSDEDNINAKCDTYPGRCDFERENYCGWQKTSETDTTWDISSPNDASYYRQVLVTRDHTKNSESGKLLHFGNRAYYNMHKPGYVARLSSKVIEATDSSCKFRFFYTYGTKFNSTKYDQMKDIGSLTIYLRRDEINVWKQLFVTREVPGQYYEKVIIPLGDVSYPFEIIIEGKTGTTNKVGGWAVDDVSFTSGCTVSNKTLPLTFIEPTTAPPEDCDADEFYCVKDQKCIDSEMVCDFVPQCSDASDEAKCGTCTFDDDKNPTCGWSDYRGNKWTRVKGPQGINGLTSGVTEGGYYMYIKKDKGGATTSKAILRSVNFHDASSTCSVSFYYFMSGITNSDAELKLQLQTKKREDVLLWKESSDQGDKWQNATVSIGSRDAGWYLDFIATHVMSKGDIAIDDVEFLLCAPPFKRKCANDLEFACLSGECIDKNLVCDFSKDCPDNSDEMNCTVFHERCDFEKGNICGWQHNSVGNVKWVVTSGSELNEESGLSRDHTTQLETGKFLLASTTRYIYWTDQAQARIISTPFMADTSGDCKLRVWVHLYKEYRSSLTIYYTYSETTNYRKLVDYYGSSGDVWERKEVPIKSKFPFQVIIAGAPATGKKGEVAIDDISFTPACIPVYTVITTPVPTIYPRSWCEKNGQFTCDDNSCVPFEAVCDFKVDCPYGRDEKSCPAFCDFELGSTCGWTGITKGGDGVEINVTIAKDAYRISRYAPKVDKTTNTSDGSYLIFHPRVRSDAGPIDQFVSPKFKQSAATCKFSFWHTAGGSYAGLFNIRVTLKTDNDSIDMVSFSNTNKWVREEMGLGRQKGNFSISISNAKWINDFVALDDIEFINCALPKKAIDICTEFRCKVTKACVDFSRVCDLTDDCGDNSDEANCPEINFITNDFENDLGVFRIIKEEKRAPLTWEIKSGSYPFHFSSRVGPPFDHTLSSPKGRYAYMSTGRNKEFGKRAWLVSGVFQKNAMKGECKMRFYYFMYGKNVNQLNVYIRTTDNLNEKGQWTKIWSQTKAVGNFWMRGSVDIREASKFEIILEGMAGVDTDDPIALDDITFTQGCE